MDVIAVLPAPGILLDKAKSEVPFMTDAGECYVSPEA